MHKDRAIIERAHRIEGMQFSDSICINSFPSMDEKWFGARSFLKCPQNVSAKRKGMLPPILLNHADRKIRGP